MPPKLKNQKKAKYNKKDSQSYLADDENFQKFSNQLAKIGLELRDITSDGNCCFRALSDQMTGNENLHLDYRKRVCQYMRENKEEFEPFVVALIADDEEDNNSNSGGKNNNNKSSNHAIGKTRQATRELANSGKKLDATEKYIRNLEQPGTYADNGCLVAFARLFQVDINIHQLDLEIWTINGSDMALNGYLKKGLVRQLHLSYHNGEHYSSIRPIGDNSKNPTNITINEQENTKKSSQHHNEAANRKDTHNSLKSIAQSHYESNGAFSNYINDSYTYPDNLFAEGDNNNNHLNGDYFGEDECQKMGQTETDDANKLEYKIEQIIEITKCFDISLIRTKLDENQNDVNLTIDAVINDQNKGRGGENDEIYLSSGGESSNSFKMDKKQEKKQRQMERQRIKVLEQREKEAQSKSLKSNALKNKNVKLIDLDEFAASSNRSQQKNEPQSDEAPKIDINVQTKSI